MVRKQILITPEQSRRLKAHARTLELPESEIIRAAIDQFVGAEFGDDDWKRQLLAFAGSLESSEADHLEKTVEDVRLRGRKRLVEIARRMRSKR